MAPTLVHDVLRAPGQALDPRTRSAMEARFGYDFSGVRVHTGDGPAESARAIGALAYTAGRDIVFGNAQYAPDRSDGQRLIAHELAHVVQQRGRIRSQPLTIGQADGPGEHEARTAARQFHAEGSLDITPGSSPPGVLQRELLAYNEDEATILPTGPEPSMSIIHDTCSGSAGELTTTLQPLIDSGDVLATDDGRRTFYAHCRDDRPLPVTRRVRRRLPG